MSQEIDNKPKPCCHQNEDKKLKKISDLPLYGNPYPRSDKVINEELGYIENGVKTIREEMTKYLSVFSGTAIRAKQIVGTAFEHSKSTYEYVSSEANTVPKAIAITSSAFIGLLLASRKGFFKKITYTSIGLTAGAAACYPQKTKELTQLGFYIIKTKGPEIVKEYTGVDLKEKVGSKDRPKPEPKTIDTIGQEVSDVQYYGFRLSSSVKSNLLPSNNGNQSPTSTPVKGDYGMSKKEDKDLYANRSIK